MTYIFFDEHLLFYIPQLFKYSLYVYIVREVQNVRNLNRVTFEISVDCKIQHKINCHSSKHEYCQTFHKKVHLEVHIDQFQVY